VVRTLFLLRFVSEGDLRQSIRAETTKVESYNDFLDWIGFGGPVIKSGDPVEQLKQVKYMDLVANAIMLHNVADLTDVLSAMVDEGLPVTRELASHTSPYMRDSPPPLRALFLSVKELAPQTSAGLACGRPVPWKNDRSEGLRAG
jgi:hypothetical protein